MMFPGERYLVKTDTGTNILKVIHETSACIKVTWSNGITEWIYKSDFKKMNNYVDPKKMVIEKL